MTGFTDDKLQSKNDASTPTRTTKSGAFVATQSSKARAKKKEVRYELDAIEQLKSLKDNLCRQVFLVKHT